MWKMPQWGQPTNELPFSLIWFTTKDIPREEDVLLS